MYTSPYVTYPVIHLDIWPPSKQKAHLEDPGSRPSLPHPELPPRSPLGDLDYRQRPTLKRKRRITPLGGQEWRQIWQGRLPKKGGLSLSKN